jgi:hypothetical protein
MKERHHNFLTPNQHECQHSLSIAMSTYPNTLEPLLGPNIESILLELEEKFPPVNPHPRETIGAIMYKSGQRSVIEWLRNRLEDD